jgi:uncharacterized membrane protein YbaN (DUF454 family)
MVDYSIYGCINLSFTLFTVNPCKGLAPSRSRQFRELANAVRGQSMSGDDTSPDTPRRDRRAYRASQMRRLLFLIGGWIFTALGIIGLILPLMPGTVFLILAAWCFSRSSPRFEAWLVSHPRLGPQVRRWRETGSISRRVKYIACGSMVLSFAVLALTDAPEIALWTAGASLIAAGTYVASRPEG